MKPFLKSIAKTGALAGLFAGSLISGCTPSIKFTQPVAQFDEKTQSQLTVPNVESPVQVCMEVKGYILKPATMGLSAKEKEAAKNKLKDTGSLDDVYADSARKNIIDKSSGHYHLLVDVQLSEHEDLSLHMKKDEKHIPMVSGEPCKLLNLAPGPHRVQAIFAYENHTPVQPVLTNAINFVVKN